jgi:O-antigen/teichoic acid export membrane protein
MALAASMPGQASPTLPGLLRAVLTLLAGGVMAQALPLLLGPLLTRLYTPQNFGIYHLFAAAAANFAAVACARYEFALPMVREDREAEALRALCLWILLGVTFAALLGGVAWAVVVREMWPLYLPLSVAVLGVVSLATLWATRLQRFRLLAAARALQYGGGALAQAGAGLAQAGVTGLIAGPIAAVGVAALVLRLRIAGWWKIPRAELRMVAQRFREFPLLNTPHAFVGALQDTLSVALIGAALGPAAAGFWGLALRYLKAPATLVGAAVSQALYPRLAHGGPGATHGARRAVVRVMAALSLIAAPLVLLLWVLGPRLFEIAFGSQWREAGELARALAFYIGVHFVASPLGVVTMAWQAQGWALRLALLGQVVFVLALLAGLKLGGLVAAGWCVSAAMLPYFGWYFWKLATWPIVEESTGEVD